MNLIELQRALRQLRLGSMAAVLETRLHQAQRENMAPIDLMSCLVSDELNRRSERLLDRRRKQAEFRDPHKTLDQFDFNFNPKMNRSLVFDLATCAFITKREDALFLGPGGTGKSQSQGVLFKNAPAEPPLAVAESLPVPIPLFAGGMLFPVVPLIVRVVLTPLPLAIVAGLGVSGIAAAMLPVIFVAAFPLTFRLRANALIAPIGRRQERLLAESTSNSGRCHVICSSSSRITRSSIESRYRVRTASLLM
jgi:hypothetical protein